MGVGVGVEVGVGGAERIQNFPAVDLEQMGLRNAFKCNG